MDLGLNGKIAVVTGGSSGVGREIALSLAAEGANVAVNYRSSGKDAEILVDGSSRKAARRRPTRPTWPILPP
jgi:NAD(P)-dependent dehydrogenase (short-subunit alcohol dehydrogenase family)